MTETSTSQPGFLHRLVLRLLLVAVIVSAAVGVAWIITGRISPAGARLLLNGVGMGIFGAFGLGAQHAGKKTPSWFARLGPVAAILGCVLWLLGVWFDAWTSELWWRVLGICFFVSFAGMRGALISAADIDGAGTVFRRIAIAAVAFTMSLGVLLSVHQLSPLGWRLFGIGALIEMAAVVAVLVHRSPPARKTE
jgi:hypothetical protein